MTRMPAEVASVIAAHSAQVAARLKQLRRLILDAAETPVEETLKWGQPAYLSQGGSTIRIDATRAGGVALYFICTTDLVARFREFYPELSYEGNRAIHLPVRGRLPEAALKHCIALALSYKLTASARSRGAPGPRRTTRRR